MNRPYTAQSPYSLTPTERIHRPRKGRRYGGGHRADRYAHDADRYAHDADRYAHMDGDLDGALATDLRDDRETDVLPPYPGDDYDPLESHADYEDDYNADYEDEYDEARIDRRWMWIAGVAGGILFVSVITASLILGGGDSGSVSATIVSTEATSSAAPVPPKAPRVAAPPAMPSMPAETVTTVTPAPSATAPAPTAQPLLPAPQAAPPAPATPGTVTYQITGDRRLIDLVTVIYTDQQGALVTDINVALPWSKTLVLDPGVTLSSVTATSVAGQLNCSITDANGALIAMQNNNSMITNCTR